MDNHERRQGNHLRRSRSRSRDRSRERREKRNKPSRFDDPNPIKMPEFAAPPGSKVPAPAPAQSSRRSKWTDAAQSDMIARSEMVSSSVTQSISSAAKIPVDVKKPTTILVNRLTSIL